MKKILLATVVMASSVFSFNAFAQIPECDEACPANADCPALKCDRPDPFKGITLTADQQAKLKALDESSKAKNKEMKQQREAKAKADRAQRVADRRAAKQEYLNNVKAILGPDQYVVFLENMVIDQPAPKAGIHKAKRGDRHHGKDMKRPDRKPADRKAPASK